jgi:hypothetical protein
MATNPNEAKKMVTIVEAAKMLGVRDMYVRQLLKKGAFPGAAKVRIAPELETMRWEIPVASVEARKTNPIHKSRRSDGRSRYVLYATAAELAKISAIVKETGAILEKPKYYSNSKKAKAARAAAKATKPAKANAAKSS